MMVLVVMGIVVRTRAEAAKVGNVLVFFIFFASANVVVV